MYLLAIFCPPIAVAMCNRPIQACINFALCFFFCFPAWIHAFFVVADFKANERNQQMIAAMQGPRHYPSPPPPPPPGGYNPFDHIR
jgi:uncharacterized membrane protein YqaE (UPF0057 family)